MIGSEMVLYCNVLRYSSTNTLTPCADEREREKIMIVTEYFVDLLLERERENMYIFMHACVHKRAKAQVGIDAQ